jgi:hypothetical protein
MSGRTRIRTHPSAVAATLALVVGLVAGCGASDSGAVTYPPSTIGPERTVTPAVGQTRSALVAALGAEHLVLQDVATPYREAEAPLLANAARAVYQVILPDDPDKGYIIVYEFLDPGRAAEAAAEQQRYLETGPGKVQTPLGTVHVIRGVGTTVVTYSWLPEAANDPDAPGIQRALETLGVGYPVV